MKGSYDTDSWLESALVAQYHPDHAKLVHHHATREQNCARGEALKMLSTEQINDNTTRGITPGLKNPAFRGAGGRVPLPDNLEGSIRQGHRKLQGCRSGGNNQIKIKDKWRMKIITIMIQMILTSILIHKPANLNIIMVRRIKTICTMILSWNQATVTTAQQRGSCRRPPQTRR